MANLTKNFNDAISLDVELSEKIKNIKIKDKFWIAKHYDIKNEKPVQFLLKRMFELTGIVIGLALISPILILIAIAVKLDSPGPILYKQKRIGYLGKTFYMYKFRSMYKDADKKLKDLLKHNETNECMFKMKDDPRITKVGKFLRKYSLDEFPQLINCLRGEMSLVGFRPPTQNELEGYKSWHYVRFSSMPGLTGPWQVSGRSNIKEFDEVIKLEYRYSKNWKFIKDVAILFKTIPVVLFGKDAA